MRKAAKKEVGHIAIFEIAFNPTEHTVPFHPKFREALKVNKEAKRVFDNLRPSSQKEILKYLSHLKTEEFIDRNVKRALNFLLGKERFIGRDKP